MKDVFPLLYGEYAACFLEKTYRKKLSFFS